MLNGNLTGRVRGRLWRERERLRHKLNLSDNRHKCYACAATFNHFLPYRDGEVSQFTRLLECVGSDPDNFWRPACSCFNREQHLLMYFDALKPWDRVKGGQEERGKNE